MSFSEIKIYTISRKIPERSPKRCATFAIKSPKRCVTIAIKPPKRCVTVAIKSPKCCVTSAKKSQKRCVTIAIKSQKRCVTIAVKCQKRYVTIAVKFRNNVPEITPAMLHKADIAISLKRFGNISSNVTETFLQRSVLCDYRLFYIIKIACNQLKRKYLTGKFNWLFRLFWGYFILNSFIVLKGTA